MPDMDVCAGITSDTYRAAGVDVLVKAAVPCFVNVEMSIRLPAGTPQPDVLAIQAAVAAAIQALPFGTAQISSFVVHKAVTSLLPTGEVTAVQFVGGIYAPSGVDLVILPSTTLEVPTDLANIVSPSNVFFSCSPATVQVTFV
jgi:hypothetical protein